MMVSDRYDKNIAERSEKIIEEKYRVTRNAMFGGIVGSVMFVSSLGGLNYLEKSEQISAYEKANNLVIEIRKEMKRRTPFYNIDDPMISESLQLADERRSEQINHLEKALKRSYELRDGIANSQEYKNISNKQLDFAWLGLGGILLSGFSFSYYKIGDRGIDKFKKSIGAVPVVSKPRD